MKVRGVFCDEIGNVVAYSLVRRSWVSQGRVVVLAVMWESKSFGDNGRFRCWVKECPKDVLRLNFEHKETSLE